MKDWKHKLKMRLPAIVLLAASLLFWGLYDRYELAGPILLENPSRTEATRVRGDCSETNGYYILTVASDGKTASLYFRMPDGPSYEQIRIKGRMRTHEVVEGPNSWRCARLLLIQYDSNNKWIPGHHSLLAEKGTTGWTKAEQVFEVDPQAVHTDLVIQQTGISGSAMFDQLRAEPVRLRTSFIVWRIIFAGLWMVMGIIYFRRCRLNRRKLRWLILLNAAAIIIGTMMPEKWIEETTDYAKDEAVKVIQKKATEKPSPDAQPTPPAVTQTRKAPIQEDDGQHAVERLNEMIGHVHGAGHFLLFASLCFLVYCSASLEKQPRSYYLKVAADVLLFAAITESLQHLTMDRTPGVSDWLKDVYGMLAALALFLVVKAMAGLRPKSYNRAAF